MGEKVIDLVKALKKLDRGYNLVPLWELRKEMNLPHMEFDSLIMQGRKQGVITCSALEARFGSTQEQRDACLREGDTLLGYVSIRE